MKTKYDRYLEQISRLINNSVSHYSDKNLWDKNYRDILDLIYDALIDTYTEVSMELKDMYLTISDEIIDIDDLVYTKDGKTLPQRVKSYWDEGYTLLKKSDNPQQIKLYLLNMIDRILSNEIQNVKAGVKKAKTPIIDNDSLIEVIEITDGECCSNGGTYLASDGPDLPPYHINCQCDYFVDFYDPTDEYDLQVLHDLGWEEE